MALALSTILPAETVCEVLQTEEVPGKIRSRILQAFTSIYAPFYAVFDPPSDDVPALTPAAKLLAEVGSAYEIDSLVQLTLSLVNRRRASSCAPTDAGASVVRG